MQFYAKCAVKNVYKSIEKCVQFNNLSCNHPIMLEVNNSKSHRLRYEMTGETQSCASHGNEIIRDSSTYLPRFALAQLQPAPQKGLDFNRATEVPHSFFL